MSQNIPKKRKFDFEEGVSAKKIKIDQLKIQDCKVVLVDIMKNTKHVNLTDLTPNEQNDLKNESMKEIEVPTLECKVCCKTFKSSKGLNYHIKNAHEPAENKNIEKFECDICGKQTSTKNIMLNHMRVHLPAVECPICRIKMRQPYLRTHIRDYHNTNEEIFACSICCASFRTKTLLKQHRKLHDKKLECEICGKKFPAQCYLKKHRKELHENPGSFACDECGKKCNTKSNLMSHQKVHDRFRQKPFKCQKCSYSTDCKTSYESHQKTHQRQEERLAAMKNPLKCEKCGKFSRDKNALRVHMRDVHPFEKFQCDLCGKYVKTMINLKRHIIRHLFEM